MILGLDFGTSTTGVSELTALGQRQLLSIGFQNSELIPSIIAETSSGTWLFGQEALIEFQNDKEGIRLVKNCKNFIGNSPDVSSNDFEDTLIAKFLNFVFLQVKQKYGYDAINDPEIKLRASCPASWNWKQRSRLIRILVNHIGARVVNAEIVDEPSAAGVNFINYLDQQNGKRRALVFDMGGGTLDLAVLEVKEGDSELTVLSARSEPIAGNKLDDAITQLVLKQALLKIDPLLDVPDDLESLATSMAKRLSLENSNSGGLIDWIRFRVEDLKKSDLAQDQDATIPNFLNFLSSRFPAINMSNFDDFDLDISAEQFRNVVNEFLDTTKSVLNRAIQDSLFTGTNIDEIGVDISESKQTIDWIILAGGMTNITAIRDWIDDEFPGRVVEAYFGDPQNLVASGLAPMTILEERFPANSRFRPDFHLASGGKIFYYAYTPLFNINPGSREDLFLRVVTHGEGRITKYNLLLEATQFLGAISSSGDHEVIIYPDGRMIHDGETWDIFTGINLTKKPPVSKSCSMCGRANCPGLCSN